MSHGRVVVVGTVVAIAAVGCFGCKTSRSDQDPKGVAGGIHLVYRVDVARAWEPARSRDELVQRAAETVRQRLATLTRRGTVQVRGDEIDVSIPDVAAAPQIDVVKRALSRSGRLEVKLVDDGSALMQAVMDWVPREAPDGVAMEAESWSDERTGGTHADVFLTAPTRTRLEQAIAKLEREMPRAGDHDFLVEQRERDWRSYYAFREVHLDNHDFEDAEVVLSGDGRPEVAVRVLRKIGELTERSVGRKLATVFEGQVLTAPVVRGKVPNGQRVRWTPGAQQEAKDLVAMLRMPSLPAPIHLLREETVAPRR